MLIKKSLLEMFISSFLQLWTTNKSKNFQKSKKSKKSKKSLLVTFIAWFKSWFKSWFKWLDLNQANPGYIYKIWRTRIIYSKDKCS